MTIPVHSHGRRVIPVSIPIEETLLHGDLRIPDDASGVVIFIHSSASSHISPRNRYVADELNKQGLASLLLDLLTEAEQRIDAETMEYRFDTPLLSSRSTLAVNWVHGQPGMSRLPIGLFASSTAAAAAMITAAAMKQQVAAVVSRGGRPDLAQGRLEKIEAPTLLIVGGKDEAVLALNRKAMAEIRCVNALHVISGATHLFEEPGALEQVVTVAGKWFLRYMRDWTADRAQRVAG